MEESLKIELFFNTQDWTPPIKHLQTKLCWEEYLLTTFEVMILAITVPHMTAQGFGRLEQATQGTTRLSKHRAQLCTCHVQIKVWSPHLRRIKAMSPLYQGVCKVICSSRWPNWCQCRGWHSSWPFGDGERYVLVGTPQVYMMLSWSVWKHKLLSTGSGSSNAGWQHGCPHNSHPCRELWMSPQPKQLLAQPSGISWCAAFRRMTTNLMQVYVLLENLDKARVQS